MPGIVNVVIECSSFCMPLNILKYYSACSWKQFDAFEVCYARWIQNRIVLIRAHYWGNSFWDSTQHHMHLKAFLLWSSDNKLFHSLCDLWSRFSKFLFSGSFPSLCMCWSYSGEARAFAHQTQVSQEETSAYLQIPISPSLSFSLSLSNSLSLCLPHPSAHSFRPSTLQILSTLATLETEMSLSSHISGNVFYIVSRSHQRAHFILFVFSQRLSSC